MFEHKELFCNTKAIKFKLVNLDFLLREAINSSRSSLKNIQISKDIEFMLVPLAQDYSRKKILKDKEIAEQKKNLFKGRYLQQKVKSHAIQGYR